MTIGIPAPDKLLHEVYDEYVAACSQSSNEEQIEAVKRIQANQDDADAKQSLLDGTIRLIISIASHYNGFGVELEDLVQEGVLGLFVAVQKFDPKRHHAFSTYAVWWIRQRIARYLCDHKRTIRLPAYRAGQVSRIERIRQEMAQELGRQPTDDELHERCMESKHVGFRGGTKLHTADLLTISYQPTSLDQPPARPSNDGLELIKDLIEDTEAASPEELTDMALLTEVITDILEELPKDDRRDRRRKVLEMRFGLGEFRDNPCTLEEIGAAFGLTRERGRQLVNEAARSLRHLRNIRRLREFL